MIEIQHARKQFPGAAASAVEDCSLSVEAGELLVLLGPSGCGKTTLLKLINRLYELDGGRILIEGTDTSTRPATALRRRIGYVIQQIGLFPHMRVEENIATVPRLLGWSQDRIDHRIDELLDLVGLPRVYRTRYPRMLSGGEQQRVGLARALAADPAIMLMDEPFGALDAITRARLQDELREIQRRLRKSIVFVTHDVDEALRLADRMAVMRAGRIVQHDTPLNLLTHPQDGFVRELLSSDDVLRRLSLVPVRAALTAGVQPAVSAHDASASHQPGPTQQINPQASIRADDNLRTALIRMLQLGVTALAVMDGEKPIGELTFEDVRRIVAEGLTPEPAA